MIYKKIIRPLLFHLDAERSHTMVLKLLKCWGAIGKAQPLASQPVKVMGLIFPNRIGLAAGLDKNGEAIDGWATLGFGCLEIGTVTPKPQRGNAQPRLFRLPQQQALLNRMGFNNHGVEQMIANIKRAKYQGILGINIGKNAHTPIEQATNDYLFCLTHLYAYASYITINISSPNTKNLRDLQHGAQLENLLAALKNRQQQLHQQHKRYVPLVVKIAPDLTGEEIATIAQLLLTYSLDAVIATNTTKQRMGIDVLAKEQGGLSGAPLTQLSTTIIRQLSQHLQHKIPIIAAGGIMSPAEAKAKLAAGASLIQLYTGLIYHGPALLRAINQELSL
ncbi:MAG: quinone-dependent dihydroorotate dehydrogenase [Gammaproteobacteria bacterium]|nr:quinone-dependent dihydroorotate dehydrogenase [Gammaproteobacteria bacterium]